MSHPTPWRHNVPNILTIGRTLSIPVIVYFMLSIHQNPSDSNMGPIVLILLFILACATDFLDGYWARKWNVASDFGRMFDPIADKLLVAASLITIAIIRDGQAVILIPALAIVGRDILVSGAREHAALSGRAMPPTQLAKWKTAFEMLAIALFIVWISTRAMGIGDVPAHSFHFGSLCLWLAAILSVYTGTLYFRAALKP